MLLLLLNYVVLRVLWKINVHLISTLVNKSLYYYYYYYFRLFHGRTHTFHIIKYNLHIFTNLLTRHWFIMALVDMVNLTKQHIVITWIDWYTRQKMQVFQSKLWPMLSCVLVISHTNSGLSGLIKTDYKYNRTEAYRSNASKQIK